MKLRTNILKVVTIAALLMGATACVTNSGAELFDEPQQIAYNAVVGLSASDSRAVISDLNYPEDMPFAAFAAQLGEGKNWADDKAEATTLIDGDAVAYNIYVPGKWTTQIPYYWPDLGSVSFFAYAPYNDAQGNPINNIAFTPTTGELKVTAWDVNDAKYKDVDLMVADPKYDLTSALAPSGVPTAFRHKLALVSFKAGLIGEYNEGGTTYQILVRKVTLKNIYTQGNYSTTTDSGRWTDLSAVENVVVFENASGVVMSHETPATLGENVLVMPQGHVDAADGAILEIVYYDTKTAVEKTLQITLKNKFPTSAWAMNNHYTYLVMFNKGDPDYIEFATPSIGADWADGGTFNLTIE